ncbi:MAG: PilZ domain-containing protein [Spirochaetaceae bacterium]|jgi:c-di-GMP-binding flagellar brake protein YcgR|nr:PilZ domain-containing protein [Spirochaetaceae bacterium]
MAESRKFQRADFGVMGVISQGKASHEFYVLNLSLKGILLNIDTLDGLESNKNVVLTIQLTNSDIQIRAEAVIMHNEKIENQIQLGCKFLSIDPESMIHLRRLLELNTIPEGEIERELSFLKD